MLGRAISRPAASCRRLISSTTHLYASAANTSNTAASAASTPAAHPEAAGILGGLGLDVDAAAFERDGCGIIRGFATPSECEAMMARMGELIDAWDPEDLVVFRTDEKQEEAQGKSDYFLDSGEDARFFLEPWAVDEATGGLSASVPKHESLNKVGHGLHVSDPVFRAYSESPKVAALTRVLGWEAPVLPQSMYIFKQPRDGGEVTSHQDSTFLHTEPRQTCLGLWLALQDATLTNGCVWARPGSHREPLRRRFYRNPAHFGAGGGTGGDGDNDGDPDAPQMLFEELVSPGEPGAVPWEGAMPEGVPEDEAAAAAGFVPYECKQGDLVLIHGLVDHMSLRNTSPHSRHTFQLHLVEGPKRGVKWSDSNWLQLRGDSPSTSPKPFMELLMPSEQQQQQQ